MDDDLKALVEEAAAMRLVLVHFLARAPKSELEAISASIDKELGTWDSVGGLQGEKAILPYRKAVDGIIADAVKRS